MLYVITSFFNPENYITKRENFYKFIKPLDDAGIPWLCVEAIFGGENQLDYNTNIIKLRGKDVMWQKERMLNIAISNLPSDCDKYIWIDCDILFENLDWYKLSSKALDTYPVIQPFSSVVRLPRYHDTYQDVGDEWNSLAYNYSYNPSTLTKGVFDKHGHSGFAWGARRDALEYGLYDACITGSGDHMMAHAFCGDWESSCIKRIFGINNRHLEDFTNWAENIYKNVKAKVGFVPGRIFHLWHGDMKNRKYVIRNKELADMGFDPNEDIKIGLDNLWQWTDNGKRIESWAINYFKTRNEDSGEI